MPAGPRECRLLQGQRMGARERRGDGIEKDAVMDDRVVIWRQRSKSFENLGGPKSVVMRRRAREKLGSSQQSRPAQFERICWSSTRRESNLFRSRARAPRGSIRGMMAAFQCAAGGYVGAAVPAGRCGARTGGAHSRRRFVAVVPAGRAELRRIRCTPPCVISIQRRPAGVHARTYGVALCGGGPASLGGRG